MPGIQTGLETLERYSRTLEENHAEVDDKVVYTPSSSKSSGFSEFSESRSFYLASSSLGVSFGDTAICCCFLALLPLWMVVEK